ncbi:MAG: hypothetical protein ACTSP1_11055 [Candidatus Freyarchaeota archaeon]
MKARQQEKLGTNEIILSARNFLDRVTSFSRVYSISERLGKVLSNVARTLGYKIANNPAFKDLKNSPLGQEIRRQVISEMISQRVFEKRKNDPPNKKEKALEAADKVCEALEEEIKAYQRSIEHTKLFLEAICMIHESREKGITVL